MDTITAPAEHAATPAKANTRLQRLDRAAARWAERIGAALLLAGLAWLALWYVFVDHRVEIVGVRITPPGPLVSGSKPEVTVLFRAKNARVRAAQVTLVRGDAPWFGEARTIEAPTRGGSSMGLPPGTLAPLAQISQRATFEFRLVMDDGERSGPFMYTVDIQPSSPPPPSGGSCRETLHARDGAGCDQSPRNPHDRTATGHAAAAQTPRVTDR